jgi:hypothetical protein
LPLGEADRHGKCAFEPQSGNRLGKIDQAIGSVDAGGEFDRFFLVGQPAGIPKFRFEQIVGGGYNIANIAPMEKVLPPVLGSITGPVHIAVLGQVLDPGGLSFQVRDELHVFG